MFLQLFLLISVLKPSSSTCYPYMTFCDCVTDLKYDDQLKNWTEMEIGSEEKDDYCSSTTISRDSLANLNEIKRLSIVKQVNGIELKAFENVGKTLKFLKFNHNNLTTIKTGMFSGFRKLNRLDLRYNNIEVLERNSFQDSKIKYLDLSDNKIQKLDYFIFDTGANITRIYIRNNKMGYINFFSFNEDLQALYLDYNQIDTMFGLVGIPAPSKLKELTMSHNRLAHIGDISSLVHLETLDFSFNVINQIDNEDLEGLKMLKFLDLSNNILETFSLKALKANVTLLLSHNLLTNLEIERFKPMTLTLFGNPWNCDCLEKMEKVMVESKISRTRCDLERFSSGMMPICLNQGECTSLPVEVNSDLRRFLIAVQVNETLPCDTLNNLC